MAAGVLDGIRVLDFGRYIAGPFCAALLADLGADVIRVEKVRGSEDRFVVPLNAAGDGAMFVQVNRNKRGLTLNPMKPAGREVVRRLTGRLRTWGRPSFPMLHLRRWVLTIGRWPR